VWDVEPEPEVEQWIDELTVKEFATALPHIERLASRGNQLRMPASRALGDGLSGRFDLGRTARRVTDFFAPDRRIGLLTVFRKQRQNERTEIRRARNAMTLCLAQAHTAEQDQ